MERNRMKTYTVSLVLSIEAKNELEARKEFQQKIAFSMFDRDSVEVELEKTN